MRYGFYLNKAQSSRSTRRTQSPYVPCCVFNPIPTDHKMYRDVVGNFGSCALITCVLSLFCSSFSYHKGNRLSCTAFQTMCLPSCFLFLRSYGDYLNLHLPDALILCWQSSTDVSPSATPSSTPLVGTHAPKFGTVIPSRIFVGGIAANVSMAVTLFICTMTMSRNVDNLAVLDSCYVFWTFLFLGTGQPS